MLRSASGKPIAIGNGGFKGTPDAADQVEMGYSIIEEFQGRGFATEAMAALIDWAFSHSSVTRIITHILPDLQSSIRVLEKCGFTNVGKGTEEGAIMYQLLRKDFELPHSEHERPRRQDHGQNKPR
jgi:ribosomal-protein-alanine N-acetyltransferase